jgi:hypothetical protein
MCLNVHYSWPTGIENSYRKAITLAEIVGKYAKAGHLDKALNLAKGIGKTLEPGHWLILPAYMPRPNSR